MPLVATEEQFSSALIVIFCIVSAVILIVVKALWR